MEIPVVQRRVCKKCKELKTVDNFEFRSDIKRYRRQCYTCYKGYEMTRQKRRDNRWALLEQGLKECSECKEVKSTTEFYKDKNNKVTGLTSGCIACRKIYQDKHPQHGKQHAIKRKYGITLKQFYDMLESQDNNCAICHHPVSGRGAHTDHCHKTGKVRGILCSKCNQGLGLFKDNPELLSKAIQYLEIHIEVPV